MDGSDESECNHVPDKPTVLAVLQFHKSLLAQPFHTSKINFKCFVVLVDVTVYCNGWHFSSPWKQIT